MLQYAGTTGGITQSVDRIAVWGEIPPRVQYVDIVYADGGELIEFKNIAHVECGGVVKESGFLLPFSAVAEIFEQYAKSFYETHNPRYEILQDESQRLCDIDRHPPGIPGCIRGNGPDAGKNRR